MSDEHDVREPGWPEDIVLGEEGAVRVFWLAAENMQGLVDRLALVLSEHMGDGDELHVTYNAMQSGLGGASRPQRQPGQGAASGLDGPAL